MSAFESCANEMMPDGCAVKTMSTRIKGLEVWPQMITSEVTVRIQLSKKPCISTIDNAHFCNTKFRGNDKSYAGCAAGHQKTPTYKHFGNGAKPTTKVN